ncbi:MAG: DegV family protein, partial [Clostridia bacterium]|nr:DegV family protein [Clostridia bacterium]
GGRCSAVSSLGANLLKLHPCIEVNSGKMGVGKKYRGNMKDILVKYVKERLSVEGMKYDRTRAFVTHTCVDHQEYVDACVEAVKETGLFDAVYDTAAGATVTSHCGPNTLGVLFCTLE